MVSCSFSRRNDCTAHVFIKQEHARKIKTPSVKWAFSFRFTLSGAERFDLLICEEASFLGQNLHLRFVIPWWMNSYSITSPGSIDGISQIALERNPVWRCWKSAVPSSPLAAPNDSCECTLHRPVGLCASKNSDVHVLACIHDVPVHTCQSSPHSCEIPYLESAFCGSSRIVVTPLFAASGWDQISVLQLNCIDPPHHRSGFLMKACRNLLY